MVNSEREIGYDDITELQGELASMPSEVMDVLAALDGRVYSVDISHRVTVWTDRAGQEAVEIPGQQGIFAEPHPTLSPGADRIVLERLRQIREEGFTPADDLHRYEAMELLQAAIAYAWHGLGLANDQTPPTWPWPAKWWKPSTPVRDLEKAGALIAAQIDRLLLEGSE